MPKAAPSAKEAPSGQRMNIRRLARGHVGVGAGHAAAGIDPRPDAHVAHQRTRPGHFAGGVRSGSVRQGKVWISSGADISFNRIHADGPHVDKDLVRAGFGIGNIFSIAETSGPPNW